MVSMYVKFKCKYKNCTFMFSSSAEKISTKISMKMASTWKPFRNGKCFIIFPKLANAAKRQLKRIFQFYNSCQSSEWRGLNLLLSQVKHGKTVPYISNSNAERHQMLRHALSVVWHFINRRPISSWCQRGSGTGHPTLDNISATLGFQRWMLWASRVAAASWWRPLGVG